MKRVQHIEHAYECRACKKDTTQKAQIKRGKAPQAVIQRSIAGPTVLAMLIYDKFIQYLPLYRKVKGWERYWNVNTKAYKLYKGCCLNSAGVRYPSV